METAERIMKNHTSFILA